MRLIVCRLVAVTISCFLIFSSHFFLQEVAAAADCSIDEGHFLCKSGHECILASQVCDGKANCQDGSDEPSECDTACSGMDCEQKCIPDIHNGNKGTCACRLGFRISGLSRNKCTNVNECEEKFGICSQGCKDTEGSFVCSCMEGFTLSPNNSTCEPLIPDAKLVFALRSSIKVLSLGQSGQITTINGRPNGQTVGVTFDAGSGEVYWTDVADHLESIYRANVDGTGVPEVIVDTGLVLVEGIAYDWIAHNLYFTDSNLTHIGVCDRSGKACTILVQTMLDKPREIVLHPKSGKMYWSDWGIVASIVAAGMDGSSPTPIIDTGLSWPNGLAIDHGAERLYWVDAHGDVVEACDLDGGNRREVKTDGIKHPFSLDVFGDTVYWSDWTRHEIESCNKFTGGNHASVYSQPREQINGVAVYHPAAQPKNRVNHCDNHPCSHICVLTPSQSFRCLCPTGMRLSADRKTCKEDASKERLFLAEGSQLKFFRFHSIGRDVIHTRNLEGLQTIGTAIHNPLNDTFIVFDSNRKFIFTYNYTANKLEPLIKRHLDSVRGMDIDIVGQNLYWVDAGKQTVEVMSLRTGARFIVYHELDNRPADVVAVPDAKSIFVTIVGNQEGQILRMDMDGEEIDVIVHIQNGEPSALTYNHELMHIFWCDHFRGTIEHASIDGKMRFLAVPQAGGPYSVITHSNRIFWTDRFSPALHSAIIGTDHIDSPIFIAGHEDRFNDTAHGNFYTAIGLLNKDLTFLQELIDNHECSPSSRNFKNCSHMCLLAREDLQGKCYCPDGMELDVSGLKCTPLKVCLPGQFMCATGLCLSAEAHCDGTADCTGGEDEANCTLPSACRASDFICRSDKACISGVWHCDGERDCVDGSDEDNCPIRPCPNPTDFKCKLGRCLPSSWRCDHVVDCPGDDRSDEVGCQFNCDVGEFKCGGTGHECIPQDWVCDGDLDCTDGSDEHNKCNVECRRDEFRCMNHHCVRNRLVCNGRDDCGDNSDEASCPLNGTMGFLPGIGIRGTTIPFNMTTIRPRHGGGSSGCPSDTFWCYSGDCLNYTKVCDGRKDCFDGSDEGEGCDHSCGITHECSHTCKKSPHGSVCFCPPGYRLAEDMKFCEDINECEEGKICDHFCTNWKGGHKCSCHDEYVLRSDQKSCKAKGNPPLFVYYSKSQVRIAPQDMMSPTVIPTASGLGGLDVDAHGHYVYWSNALRGIIGRSGIPPNKIENETLFKNLATPTLLAYDWISHNVYVVSRVSTGRDKQRRMVIKICSIHKDPAKRLCTTLYRLHCHDVTAIAVAPADNYVFWTEGSYSRYASSIGAIRRGRVDGVENVNLASDRVFKPIGLAVDHVFKRVFWMDAARQVIEAVNFDGSKRSVIISSVISQRASGLAVFENWVMWSEDGENIRCRTDMQASCMHVSMHNATDARYLKLLQPSLQPAAKDPCVGSLCAYICTGAAANLKQNYTCYCPEGYASVDGSQRSCKLEEKRKPVISLRTRTGVNIPDRASDYDDDGGDDMKDKENTDSSPAVLSRRTDDDDDDSSGAATTVVVVFITILLICLIVGAVIYYQRNGGRPKMLVRPYVQQWVKYVNDPVQRWRRDSRREPLTNQDAYSEVYEASGSEHAYENPVYENSVKPKHRSRRGKDGGNVPGSLADSGILTLVDSDGPAPYDYEDISDGHYVSYKDSEKLLDKEFT